MNYRAPNPNKPVWKKAFDLLLRIYKLTKLYPNEERYGLISDMRRAANSVTHNLAEGYGRFEKKDKSRFYKISRASAYEIISQALVSSALEYIPEGDKNDLVEGYRTVIGDVDKLIKSVESR